MVFQNAGFRMIQSVAIRNESGITPTNMIFAGSDNTFTGSEIELNNEFIRKDIIWSQSGRHSKYVTTLSSVEAVGSYISATGAVGSASGSEILFFSDEVFIGEKTNTFNVQLTGEVIFRRPS
jgi:hypothetical protein